MVLSLGGVRKWPGGPQIPEGEDLPKGSKSSAMGWGSCPRASPGWRHDMQRPRYMSASLVQLALHKVEEHLGGVLCSTQPPGVTDGIHDHVSSRENTQRLQGGKGSTWETP